MDDGARLSTRQLDLAANGLGLLPCAVLEIQTVAEHVPLAQGERTLDGAPTDETGEGREQTTAEGWAGVKG